MIFLFIRIQYYIILIEVIIRTSLINKEPFERICRRVSLTRSKIRLLYIHWYVTFGKVEWHCIVYGIPWTAIPVSGGFAIQEESSPIFSVSARTMWQKKKKYFIYIISLIIVYLNINLIHNVDKLMNNNICIVYNSNI